MEPYSSHGRTCTDMSSLILNVGILSTIFEGRMPTKSKWCNLSFFFMLKLNLLKLCCQINYNLFHLGKNSSVSSLYKNYTITCQNVTTEQVYFLVTNIDFLSVLVPIPFIYR